MPQGYGIPGKTRQSKNDVIDLFSMFVTNDCPKCEDDGRTICPHEVPALRHALTTHGDQVELQVEALSVSLSVLKVGRTWNTEQKAADFCDVFNQPLPWPDTEMRRSQANGNDAA